MAGVFCAVFPHPPFLFSLFGFLSVVCFPGVWFSFGLPCSSPGFLYPSLCAWFVFWALFFFLPHAFPFLLREVGQAYRLETSIGLQQTTTFTAANPIVAVAGVFQIDAPVPRIDDPRVIVDFPPEMTLAAMNDSTIFWLLGMPRNRSLSTSNSTRRAFTTS